RREPFGPLGMVRAHLVLETVGVRDEGNGHRRFILAHRLQWPHASEGGRMLLKAEFPAARAASEPIARVISAASTVILGKESQVRLALACLLARGHLLIEDLPGVGKTTLAHVLARSLGLQFQRIQFTSDMLPAD